MPYEAGIQQTMEEDQLQLTPEEILKDMRALVVDDNEIIRKLVKNMLKMCVCQEAENGLEAVKKCESNSFDFVIMDVIMPVMSGIDATRILRKEKGFKVPIIALTGNSLQDEISGLIEVGANKVLLKPIKKGELLAEISETLLANNKM